MILTEQETMLLNDLKQQEELCRDKYAFYSSEAKDPELKQLFEVIQKKKQNTITPSAVCFPVIRLMLV